MAFANQMSMLLDKIERRLGTRQLNLPDYLQKKEWANIIIQDTLTTFSRYFPNKIRYKVTRSQKKGDYYLIDEDLLPDGVIILGVRDLSWDNLTPDNPYICGGEYSAFDVFATQYSLDDLAMAQMASNMTSLFNNGLYLDFVPPNKIRIQSCLGNEVNIGNFNIDLLIKHADNLNTISPTQMETFEELAKADIAMFLYNELKYYEGLETVFSQIDIKLSELQDAASRREDIVQSLKDSYVSAANDNQPLMFTAI